MKTPHYAAAFAILVLVAAGVSAQDRHDQQFSEHDRQVVGDWYKQHQSHPPKGMRSEDRLTPEQEQRIQPGQTHDREMRGRYQSVPRDLGRQLSHAPKNHKYVVVGQHVALVDTHSHVVRDVIHLHDDGEHKDR